MLSPLLLALAAAAHKLAGTSLHEGPWLAADIIASIIAVPAASYTFRDYSASSAVLCCPASLDLFTPARVIFLWHTQRSLKRCCRHEHQPFILSLSTTTRPCLWPCEALRRPIMLFSYLFSLLAVLAAPSWGTSLLYTLNASRTLMTPADLLICLQPSSSGPSRLPRQTRRGSLASLTPSRGSARRIRVGVVLPLGVGRAANAPLTCPSPSVPSRPLAL